MAPAPARAAVWAAPAVATLIASQDSLALAVCVCQTPSQLRSMWRVSITRKTCHGVHELRGGVDHLNRMFLPALPITCAVNVSLRGADPTELTATAISLLQSMFASAASADGPPGFLIPPTNVSLLGVVFTPNGWPQAPSRRRQLRRSITGRIVAFERLGRELAATSDLLIAEIGVSAWTQTEATIAAANIK